MRVAFIIVSCGEPASYLHRLKKQIESLNIKDLTLYVIKNEKFKEGYAQGVNKGIRRGLHDNKDFFVIANPDISFLSMTKEDLLSPSREFDIWGFGFNQKSKNYFGGELDVMRNTASLSTKRPIAKLQESSFVSGSLIGIKKEVIEKIGLWDESYFLYYEEVDYCERARRAGFKVGIDSEVKYEHFELSENDNLRKKEYLFRSRWMFFLKYASLKQKIFELIRLPKTLVEDRPFVKNFLTLNVSSFTNKLLNFVLFIFLVRYLSVQDYGTYTLVWAHIALLQPFLDFGTTSYGLVYLPQKSASQLSSLFSLRMALSLIVFLATLGLAYFLGYRENLLWFIFLTSFTLFSNALSGSLLIFSSLRQRLILPSLVSIIFNLVLIGSLVLAVINTQNLSSIFILTFLFYNILSLFVSLLLRKEMGKFEFKINLKLWKEILHKSTVFLLIGLFAGLYFKLDVFLLNFIKGPKDVGIYSAGYKFLEAFLFLAASYNIVSTPIMSRLRKETLVNLKLKIKKDLYYLSLIGAVVASSIFFFSPYFLTFIFSGEYVHAIPVLRIVIWALPFILITSVFFNSLYVLGKARIVMWMFILQTLFNIVLNLIYIPKYSYIASSYITIIEEVLNALIAFIFLYKTLAHENIS